MTTTRFLAGTPYADLEPAFTAAAARVRDAIIADVPQGTGRRSLAGMLPDYFDLYGGLTADEAKAWRVASRDNGLARQIDRLLLAAV